MGAEEKKKVVGLKIMVVGVMEKVAEELDTVVPINPPSPPKKRMTLLEMFYDSMGQSESACILRNRATVFFNVL